MIKIIQLFARSVYVSRGCSKNPPNTLRELEQFLFVFGKGNLLLLIRIFYTITFLKWHFSNSLSLTRLPSKKKSFLA